MALRRLALAGEEVLRKKSKEVKEVNSRVLELIDDLWETLAEHNGVGLAAPQVAVLRRVAVIDTGASGERLALVNPQLLEAEGSEESDEGCLSVPGYVGKVARPQRVRVRALDRDGQPFEVEGEGLLARALCHEIDHLDGVLYTDKAKDFRPTEDGKDEEGSQ